MGVDCDSCRVYSELSCVVCSVYFYVVIAFILFILLTLLCCCLVARCPARRRSRRRQRRRATQTRSSQQGVVESDWELLDPPPPYAPSDENPPPPPPPAHNLHSPETRPLLQTPHSSYSGSSVSNSTPTAMASTSAAPGHGEASLTRESSGTLSRRRQRAITIRVNEEGRFSFLWEIQNTYPVVTLVIPTAMPSGLKVGDRILVIDGELTKLKPKQEIEELFRRAQQKGYSTLFCDSPEL